MYHYYIIHAQGKLLLGQRTCTILINTRNTGLLLMLQGHQMEVEKS